ncbi:MAG: efflux RND transporter periplasmic adaptor subunit [Pirellulales bacterium]
MTAPLPSPRWTALATAARRPIARTVPAVFAALLVGVPAVVHAQAPAGPAVPVVVAAVEERQLAAGQSFVGTVYPARVSDVGSAVDGRLVRLPIVDGQRVEKGDPIAELLRGLLEIEREGASAELERLRQALAELEAGSRPEELDQARAQVEGAAARLEFARSRFDRLRRLAERGTSTVEELHDAETDQRQAAAQLAATRAALALTEAGPRKEQIAQAAAAAASQEAVVERIDDQLGKHTIRAPFAGWVVQRFTEEGQWLARGGLVARIAELDEVEVVVQVPELSIGRLRTADSVRLEFDAAADRTWIGRVARVVPQADLLARSFPVRVRLVNQIVDGEPVLRGGMIARAWLPVGKAGRATVVPKDALVLGGAVPLVYVVTPAGSSGTGSMAAGSVRPVEVTLGVTVEGSVEVRGGLAAGDLVVVRGNERLRPGAAVSFPPLQP